MLIGAAHKRGHILLDLDHTFHAFLPTTLRMNRHVGGDDIAILQSALKGVNLIAMGQLADGDTAHCGAKAGSVGLAFADLRYPWRRP